MKKLLFKCFGAAAFFALASVAGQACQPCETTLSLKDSLAAADAVVVGRKTDSSDEAPGPDVKPQCGEFEVVEVLKGEVGPRNIKARAWYGMCPYGIIVGNRETYLLILKKISTEAEFGGTVTDECGRVFEREGYIYGPVEYGCAVKTLPVELGEVEADGVRMTLAEFREKYGLGGGEGARPAAAPPAAALESDFWLFRAAALFW